MKEDVDGVSWYHDVYFCGLKILALKKNMLVLQEVTTEVMLR
jgi:hypothetical protein